MKSALDIHGNPLDNLVALREQLRERACLDPPLHDNESNFFTDSLMSRK
jgi:hypothetical protein